MRNQMSKWQLMTALTMQGAPFMAMYDTDGKRWEGILCSVERESGSGCSFNVVLNCNGVRKTFYVRTTD